MLLIIARLQPDRFFDAAQIAFQQRDAGAFHRHIGPGPHRDADIGGGECRRVIDTVTGHRDDAALLAQAANAIVFMLRLDAGFDFVDAEFPGDGARSALVVAGQHDDFEAELVQLLDRGWC